MSECWSEKPKDRPTFQWICAAVNRLISDQKVWAMICRYMYTEHNTQINQDRKPSAEFKIILLGL